MLITDTKSLMVTTKTFTIKFTWIIPEPLPTNKQDASTKNNQSSNANNEKPVDPNLTNNQSLKDNGKPEDPNLLNN